MSYDAEFKRIFERLMTKNNIQVESAVSVGTLPLEIDLVFFKNPEDSFRGIWGIFEQYAKKYDIVEFKSESDKATIQAFHKLRAYMCYFWEKHELDLDAEFETAGWFITSRRPQWLKHEIEKQRITQVESGLYQFVPSWHIYIVVINDLEVKNENFPFLIFSTGQKLVETIRQIYKEERQDLIIDYQSIIFGLHNSLVMTMAEAEEITITNPDENYKRAIEFIGYEKAIEFIGYEKVAKILDMKEFVKTLDMKELAKYLTKEQKEELKDSF